MIRSSLTSPMVALLPVALNATLRQLLLTAVRDQGMWRWPGSGRAASIWRMRGGICIDMHAESMHSCST